MDNTNHPIPQDVSHFQFKLIGEMTLKQFAYIATGAILAWITFALPLFFLIKILFIAVFVGAGLILAFVPFEGRPTDVMLSYFFKALLAPNQYVYRRETMHQVPPGPKIGQPIQQPSVQSTAQILTTNIPLQQGGTMGSVYPQTRIQPEHVKSVVMTTLQISPQTTIQEPVQKQILVGSEKIQNISQAIHDKTREEQKIREQLITPIDVPVLPSQSVQEQLDHIVDEKKALEKELLSLRQQKPSENNPVAATIEKQASIPMQESQQSTQIVKQQPVSTIPTMPDFPNLIIGVIKDARGNVLPNILIDVKDKENNPVRAFKTNPLGQFASATPLLNGSYTIYFEDQKQQHKFKPVTIEVTGRITQPLEIISTDDREELRKDLFGGK